MNSTASSRTGKALQTLMGWWWLMYPVSYYFSNFGGGAGSNTYLGQINHEMIGSVWMSVMALLLLAAVVTGRTAIRLTRGMCWWGGIFLMLVGWVMLSQSWSVNPHVGFREVRVWLFYGAEMLIVAGYVCGVRGAAGWIRRTMALHCTLLGGAVIYHYFLNGFYVPYISYAMNRSLLGETLIVMVPFLIGWRMVIPKNAGRWAYVGAMLGYVAVLIMGQRAPLYALWAVLAVLFGIILWRRPSRWKVCLRGVLFLVALTAFFVVPHRWNGRLEDWDTTRRAYNVSQALDTFDYRVTGVLVCGEIFRDFPVTGSGQGTFNILFPEYHARVMSKPGAEKFSKKEDNYIFARAHCEPAQVAAELGLVGLVLWFGAFVVLPGISVVDFARGRGGLGVAALALGMGAMGISSLASSFGVRMFTGGLWLVVVSVLWARRFRVSGSGLWVFPRRLILVQAVACMAVIGLAVSFYRTFDIIYYFSLIEATKDNPKATYEKKLKHYARLAERDPANPMYSFAAANVMAGHRNMESEYSPRLWRTAGDMGLFGSSVVIMEAQSRWMRGEREQAVARIEEGLRTYPHSWRMLAFRAAYAGLSGDPQTAQHYWDRYRQTRPPAPGLLERILPATIAGQDVRLTRQELYQLPGDFVQVLGVIYHNSTEGRAGYPKMFWPPEKPKWE
ncbi:MAG: O-antigen ligase family protein [Verrucomicrobiae bacterium]|nr:O-antigen ligase family protein [Verrucomicrobiae bacterium]